MLFGRVVQLAPGEEPDESEAGGNEKCRAPGTERVIQEQNQERRDRAADRGTTIEKGYCPGPFAVREPLGNRLGRTRPVRGFAHTQEEAEYFEGNWPLRERGESGDG